MARPKGSRIFFKYLISYITILLLPISIMSFVVYHFFVGKLQEEVIAGNLNILDKVRYVMDDQLKRVEDTTYQIMLKENHLSQYRASDDPGYKAWGIVNELKRYYTVNPFIDEIWLYYRGESSVYTSNSVYSLSMLSKQIYQFDNWTQDEIVNDLNTLEAPIVRSPSKNVLNHKRLVPILIPILPHKDKPYATLVYLIRESSIQKVLSSHVHTGGSTWVLDQNDRIVTGVGGNAGDQQEVISSLVAEHRFDTYRKVFFGEEEHYLFMVQSEQTGWKFVTLLPVRLVLDKVRQAQQIFQYGITFVLLSGGLFIFFSMRWNYRPIHQLKLETERILPSEAKSMNELETVRYALNSLARQNRELNERMKAHADAAKKQWLLSLLKGDLASAEELKDSGEQADFPDEGSLFRVAVVEFPGEKGEWRMTAQAIERLLPDEMLGYGIQHIDINRYILLMILDNRSDRNFIAGMDRFREALRDAITGPVTIGVGSCSGISDIPRSYLEAITAIDYRFIQGNDRTIYFEEIPQNKMEHEVYPYQELEQLRNSIRSGKASSVETGINAIVTAIRTKQPPLIVVRALCFEIIRTVNEARGELGLNEGEGSGYPDIFSLERFETMDAFEQLIRTICLDLCESLKAASGPDAEIPRSLENIIQHIEANYRSCDFSFQNMAREFGMALPNMSSYFKERTGYTLLEYTTNLRMETAKRLLLTEDITLQKIAEEVGYYNVSSFIRRFKQVTGVTPKEYRTRRQAGLNTQAGG
ncbi:helix-turn-helix domain-containing protein [Paenibacillus alkalitolerans]|uniref:helix-turn-helix domain-containing protein n=1 Tax=Paenibacillus alkalitolerans TaxID=2799335 RepID=UPI0018F30578|nr:helix-turn-helix domain-containing protein [Paenibacillus alkalitolerans]